MCCSVSHPSSAHTRSTDGVASAESTESTESTETHLKSADIFSLKLIERKGADGRVQQILDGHKEKSGFA